MDHVSVPLLCKLYAGHTVALRRGLTWLPGKVEMEATGINSEYRNQQ